jgi:hypothetical protein
MVFRWSRWGVSIDQYDLVFQFPRIGRLTMTKRLTMINPLSYHLARLRRWVYHHRTGLVLLAICLGISVGLLLRPSRQSSLAADFYPITPTIQFGVEEQPQVILQTVEILPSNTPTPLPQSTPAVLPTHENGIVWSVTSPSVYFWEAPEGTILTRLQNGTSVRLLGERSSYGNLPWIKIESPSGEGWLLQTDVFREERQPTAYIAIVTGTFLRDRPRGGVQQMLPMGTPIMAIMDNIELDNRVWVQVEIVDGTVGWVVEAWLAEHQPGYR